MIAVYAGIIAAALVLLAGCVVFALDERKRRRRQEDRVAFRAFMQPKWDEAWREVGR